MHHARISLAFSILFLLSDLAKRPFASVAQLVEQGTENPRVGGSIPPGGTKYADVAHLVERHLAKVEVASSSLVIRSRVTRLRKQSGFVLSELAASAAVGPADCAHRSDVRHPCSPLRRGSSPKHNRFAGLCFGNRIRLQELADGKAYNKV